MGFFDVLELLFDESSLLEVIAVLLAVLLGYFLAFRRRLHSVFDPLAFVLALSAVSTTVLTLMTRHGAVSVEKFAFVVATLACFYGGFLAIDTSWTRRTRSRIVGVPSSQARPVTAMTLAVLFAANFAVLSITYAFFGIPLFLESRLAQFSDSGGFGVLGRLSVGLEFSSVVLAFIALRQRSRGRRWAMAILFQFVLSALLSGSKGSLLTGLFAWLLACIYFERTWRTSSKLPRFMTGFLVFALLAPLLVIFVQAAGNSGGLGGVVQTLLIRIAAEGDGYAYFLGNDLIDSVARHDWLAPLRQVLAAFRLVAPETSINPGFEIISEVLAIDSPTSGPNSRLPIYFLYFYGYGGILFAPLLGMALGWARNRVARIGWRSPTQFALAAAVYLHVCRLEVDPQLTVSGLFGLALTLPIFWAAMALDDGRIRRSAGPHLSGPA